jgi:hypothetical protein
MSKIVKLQGIFGDSCIISIVLYNVNISMRIDDLVIFEIEVRLYLSVFRIFWKVFGDLCLLVTVSQE